MMGGRAAFLAEIAKSQTKVENEEKEKFLKVRERMISKASKLEDSLRKKHEDIFSKLKFEREKMISELQTAWRQKASEDELHSFEEAAMSYKTAQKKLFDVYDEHERNLKEDLEKTRKQAAIPGMDNIPSVPRTTKKAASGSSKKTRREKSREDVSNLEDTDESDMSSSSVEDGSTFMGTPETVQDHELFTSGSESSLGDDNFTKSLSSSRALQQAEMVIQQHETRKSPESNSPDE